MRCVSLLCCVFIFALPLYGRAGTFTVTTPRSDDLLLEQKASEGKYANIQLYVQNIVDVALADLRLTQASVDQSVLIAAARACLNIGKSFTVASDPGTGQVGGVCK